MPAFGLFPAPDGAQMITGRPQAHRIVFIGFARPKIELLHFSSVNPDSRVSLFSIHFPPQEQNVSIYGIGPFTLVRCTNRFEITGYIDSVRKRFDGALYRSTSTSDIHS